MNDRYEDDDAALEALALSDDEFNAKVSSMIQEGLNDGDIGYRHWWSIARNLKMAKMQLVLCKEAIEHIKANPDSIGNVYAVLENWEKLPRSKEHAEKWLSILKSEDWEEALAIDIEGLRLRKISPMQFALPETVSRKIVRHYYR